MALFEKSSVYEYGSSGKTYYETSDILQYNGATIFGTLVKKIGTGAASPTYEYNEVIPVLYTLTPSNILGTIFDSTTKLTLTDSMVTSTNVQIISPVAVKVGGTSVGNATFNKTTGLLDLTSLVANADSTDTITVEYNLIVTGTDTSIGSGLTYEYIVKILGVDTLGDLTASLTGNGSVTTQSYVVATVLTDDVNRTSGTPTILAGTVVTYTLTITGKITTDSATIAAAQVVFAGIPKFTINSITSQQKNGVATTDFALANNQLQVGASDITLQGDGTTATQYVIVFKATYSPTV